MVCKQQGCCDPITQIPKTHCACDPNTPDDPADALSTGFDLYIDKSGRWQLYTEGGQTGPSDDPGPNPPNCSDDAGSPLPHCSDWSAPTIAIDPFSVTAACIPWSALGVSQPPDLVRVDNSLAFSDDANPTLVEPILPTVEAIPAMSGTTCVLAAASDDYAHGGAELTASDLTVHANDWLWPQPPPQPPINHGAEFLWASAICSIPGTFADFPAGSALPSNAFCGLSRLGEMTAHDSSISAAGPVVSAVHATVTARCFPTR
jgi:hypothetical protein